MNSNIDEAPSTQEFLDLIIEQTLHDLRKYQTTGRGYSALRVITPSVLRIPRRFPHLQFDQDALDEIYVRWNEVRRQ